MESKNLLIAFIWTFVLVSVLVLSGERYGMEFVGYMIFFVMALVSTIAVEVIIPGSKVAASELEKELKELRARFDGLDGESR